MSEEETSSPTLTRSSSGFLRPSRRPPLNSSAHTSNKELIKQDMIDFQTKESNFDESTNKEDRLENKFLDESVSDDSNDESLEESKKDSNDSDYDNLQEEFNITDIQEFTNTSFIPESVSYSSTIPTFETDSLEEKDKIKSSSTDDNKIALWPIWSSGSVLIIAILYICCSYLFLQAENIKYAADINTIREEFSTQDEDLWTSFEAGVQDVIKFSRPSTFIFLYTKEAESTTQKLLNQLSKYATCEMRDCSKDAIIVTDTELNSSEIVEDYGRIIHMYKNKLEENGVMIIKHIENVRGISAQAFHSFCDEFSPLVDKALFIFTMEVDKLANENKMNFVEEYFSNKWTDIKLDTFNALITRITSMVLEIRP